MRGITNHHTKIEPAKITNAYLRPTIYPRPSTAALVLHESTNLVLSASACPHEYAVVVMLSAHQPKVATT